MRLHIQFSLTHFWSVLLVYTPWKHQKKICFQGVQNKNIGQKWVKFQKNKMCESATKGIFQTFSHPS